MVEMNSSQQQIIDEENNDTKPEQNFSPQETIATIPSHEIPNLCNDKDDIKQTDDKFGGPIEIAQKCMRI